MYNDFIGYQTTNPENDGSTSKFGRGPSNPVDDYEFVRRGIPTEAVSFERSKSDRELLLKHFIHHGYYSVPYSKISTHLAKHVSKFRCALDFYKEFSKSRVFEIEELYFRCLSEGPAFSDFIKKCRATCYRWKTTETDTEIDEEYISDLYDGYNSILHERYLIHWSDVDDVDDVKYAFIPLRHERKHEFSELLNKFWDDFRLDEIDFTNNLDLLSALKNSKMYDPISKKSKLMRDLWNDDVDITGPYFAKRTVVAVSSGNIRDTGVGDPGTIAKVKLLNQLARQISDVIPYSVNTDSHTANRRLKRVLKNNLFLHLDFKKFGLTFPRYMMNILLEKIAKSSGLNLDDLKMEDFFIQIGDDVFNTERGSVLGWLDSMHSICVAVILHDLGKRLGFDFVTFNDDVEISKKGLSDVKGTLELLRYSVCTTLDYFDVLISLNKTFGSKASVFLERYAYYDQYGIDMYKEQLTVDAYTKSCITVFPWQAKFFFAAAEQWTKSQYATERCISTCPIEFRKEEITLPLWAGGWYVWQSKGVDLSLIRSDRLGILTGILLSKFKLPIYSTKQEKPVAFRKIDNKINSLTHSSYSSGSALTFNNWTVDSIEEINYDVAYMYAAAETMCDIFDGRDKRFPEVVRSIVEKASIGVYEYQ